ncbi:hypothetical protein [Nostoc sp.]|uniref:hypothetical protein n=1 Tax=Nostoc sp. TaxID=1180 RepID=UPI002FF6880E
MTIGTVYPKDEADLRPTLADLRHDPLLSEIGEGIVLADLVRVAAPFRMSGFLLN